MRVCRGGPLRGREGVGRCSCRLPGVLPAARFCAAPFSMAAAESIWAVRPDEVLLQGWAPGDLSCSQRLRFQVKDPRCCRADPSAMHCAGLEYDLDLFNIVAVDDFNMGAMENKSLNIFNSRLVSPAQASDLIAVMQSLQASIPLPSAFQLGGSCTK